MAESHANGSNVNGHADKSLDVLQQYSYLEDSTEAKASQGKIAHAVSQVEEAAEAAKQQGDQPQEGQLRNLLARALLAKGDVEAALEATEAALNLSDNLKDKSLEAKVHLTVSCIRLKQDDLDGAVQAVREAIALYQETGDGKQEASAFYGLAGIFMEHGKFNEGQQAADKAQGLWQNEGDKMQEVKATLRLAEILALKGQLEDAIETAEEAMASAKEVKDANAEALALRSLSSFHQDTGDLDLSLDAARKERLVLEKAKNKPAAAQALQNIATIHLSREEPKEAARAAEAAKTIYKKLNDAAGQVQALTLVSQAHMMSVEKLDQEDEKEGPIKENRLNMAGSKAYHATEEAMEAIKDCKDNTAIASANLCRAEVLTVFGETRDAVFHARKATDAFGRQGNGHGKAVALMVAARGMQELRTPGLAEKAAEEALELFKKFEDSDGVASANELLNELGPSGTAIGGAGASYEAPAVSDTSSPAAAASSAGAVEKAGPDPKQVREMIRKEVEMIIGSDDDVHDDTPLMDTGLDSLSSVQFRNDLTRDFQVKLPASLMFDYPTIGALSEKIVEALQDQ